MNKLRRLEAPGPGLDGSYKDLDPQGLELATITRIGVARAWIWRQLRRLEAPGPGRDASFRGAPRCSRTL